MRGLVRRAQAVAAAAAVVVFGSAGVASAAGTVKLTWSPAGPFSYGTLAPGATSLQVFKLTNSGSSASSALKITVAPASGTPAGVFTKSADSCTGTSLGPKKSCSVSVRFTAPAAPGSYQATLTAVSNKPAATVSVTLTGATEKATPAISTSQQPGTATVGSAVADQATVTGGDNPSGTVTFNLYDNPNCTGTVLFTDTESLASGAATSNSYTAKATGTDYWQATYNGDSSNNSVSSSCSGEPVTITSATPAITTVQQPPSATVGSAVADQATVSGGFNPGGTVTFNLYNNPNCTGTVLFTDTEALVSGVATSAGYTATATGANYWQATYNGDSNNNSVSSSCSGEPVTITPATPAITTVQQPPSATVGSAVADQATVLGGDNPSGTVTFTLYGNSNCSGSPLFADPDEPLVGGVATSVGYIATATGTGYWQATYNGDSNNNAVSSSCSGEPVTIIPATPTINTTAQPAAAAVGSPVADQATVSAGFNPSGTVTFTLYGNSNCSGSPLFTDTESLASGSATSQGYTTTAVGTDYWQATYNGDANNNSVSSSCNGEPVTITPAISTSPSAGGPLGTTVTDTATLSGGANPTGTITFNLYGPSFSADCSGTPVDTETVTVSGNGTYTTPAGATPAQAGHYWWTASYSGDASNPSAGTGCGGEQVLITGDLTISPGRFFDSQSPNENIYTFAFFAPAGHSQTQTFTVTNSGNTTLDQLDVREPSAPFSIHDNCMGETLAPGQTCTFDVTFTAPATCTFPFDDRVDLSSDVTGETYLDLGMQAECE